MYPLSLLWSLAPTPSYPYGLCYAAHAASLRTFWTGKETSLLDVVECSPPRGFGGDPLPFFQKCTSLSVLATLGPPEETLLDHLLRGPLLVGRRGHAMVLKGYTPSEWILNDSEETRVPRDTPFDYSLGI